MLRYPPADSLLPNPEAELSEVLSPFPSSAGPKDQVVPLDQANLHQVDAKSLANERGHLGKKPVYGQDGAEGSSKLGVQSELLCPALDGGK